MLLFIIIIVIVAIVIVFIITIIIAIIIVIITFIIITIVIILKVNSTFKYTVNKSDKPKFLMTLKPMNSEFIDFATVDLFKIELFFLKWNALPQIAVVDCHF